MKLGQGRNDARNGSERSRTGRKGVGKGPGMDQLQERILEVFCRTREQGPLVQCITNFVTVNDCANVILAAGGSPSMAHDIREAAEAVEGAAALVCNMGAIENIDAMILAGQRANALGKPVILDPVAAGGTELRRRESRRLLEEVHFQLYGAMPQSFAIWPAGRLREAGWMQAEPIESQRRIFSGLQKSSGSFREEPGA